MEAIFIGENKLRANLGPLAWARHAAGTLDALRAGRPVPPPPADLPAPVLERLAEVTLAELLKRFWEGHDPTQGMRQGNDVGTQYRSGIYGLRGADLEAAVASRDRFAARLAERGFGDITTEIVDGGEFFYAEDYHQQYLAKNPGGYCGLGGTGVSCPVGLAT